MKKLLFAVLCVLALCAMSVATSSVAASDDNTVTLRATPEGPIVKCRGQYPSYR